MIPTIPDALRGLVVLLMALPAFLYRVIARVH